MSTDRASIARWHTDDTTIAWSLRDTVGALGDRAEADARHMLTIYVVAIDAAPIGVVAADAVGTFLQLVYLDTPHRGHQLGTCAASVVIEHFFLHREAPWLGVTEPIPAKCRRFLARLGFVELLAGMQLSRERWGQRRAQLAEGF